MKRQPRATGGDDLLLFSTSELAQYSLADGAGRLDGQGVHEHRRGGGHVDGWWSLAARTDGEFRCYYGSGPDFMARASVDCFKGADGKIGMGFSSKWLVAEVLRI